MEKMAAIHHLPKHDIQLLLILKAYVRKKDVMKMAKKENPIMLQIRQKEVSMFLWEL